MSPVPDWDRLADLLADGLLERERALSLEQAVYGLDSLDELKLHDVIATIFSSHCSVAREVHYPSSAGRRQTHRNRCDLVLCPAGRPLKRDTAPTTLFDPPDESLPQDAMWIEVKLARQFQSIDRRDSSYGSKWRSKVMADLQKVESDPAVRDAALLLILFTGTEAAIEPDLDAFETALAIAGLLSGFRSARTTTIADRIGHRFCTVVFWPTVGRSKSDDESA
jgi:hypothetical protein